MANTIRVKRRWTGSPDAPASLGSAELAYNGVTDTLYIGFGDDGSGNATSIKVVAGLGAFLALSGDQTVGGTKTFSAPPVVPTPTAADHAVNRDYVDNAVGDVGDMTKAVYDPRGIEADAFDVDNHTDGATNKVFTATEKTKLAGVATGAIAADTPATLTNKTFDANGTGNSITNIEVADFAANVVDNDATLAANSATRIPTQAAVKNYVDAIATNLGKRERVRVATTGNITIATALNAGDSLDGVTLASGDLVLVKNQSTASQNGIYVVSASPARATEFDTYDEYPGTLVAVAEGSANADSLWLCTSNAGGTLNTTDIAWSQLRVSGELLAANNLSDLADASASRGNLGLGTIATQNASNVAITGGTIDGVTLDGGTF